MSSRPASIVDGYRNMLLTKPPNISVSPTSNHVDDKKAAQKREDLLYVLWDRQRIYREAVDASWHGLVDGWACMCAYYYEDADEGEPPLMVKSVDPPVCPCPPLVRRQGSGSTS